MVRAAHVTALALGWAVSGCALATATPPSVEVTDVRLVEAGLLDQQLAVTLCVTNPNARELAFRHVTTALDVSGLPLVAGSSDQPVRLPPQSSTAVPFTVTTTVQNIGPQVLGFLRTGLIAYRVHGTVTVGGALSLTLPYSRSGQFAPLAGGPSLAALASDAAPSRCALPSASSPA